MNTDPLAPSKKLLGYKPNAERLGGGTTIDIPTDFVKFNEFIGNPIHPATHKQLPLTPYQIDFFNQIDSSPHHKYHLNKARQMGFTELVIRILLFYAITRYTPGKIIIMAGTRLDTTRDIFYRLSQLTEKLKSVIAESGPTRILFENEVEVLGLPANPEAITGLTKIKAVFMDEAAKWNLKEDLPVMNAVMPIVRSNHSDLFMISTPKGPRGFFYDIDMASNDFLKIKYSIWETENNLYSREEIQSMLNSATEDANQEYLNVFVAGRDSIFGSLGIEDEDDGLEEWK